MTIIVPHKKTKQEAIKLVDRSVDELFSGAAGGAVEIVGLTKQWADSTMTFSLTGKVGFISVPLSGTVMVDDQNVTVNCEFPAMVKKFIGEDKLVSGIQKKLSGIVAG
jgi:L-serine deaminase